MWGAAESGIFSSILISYSLNAETQQLCIPKSAAAKIKFSAAAEASWIAYFFDWSL